MICGPLAAKTHDEHASRSARQSGALHTSPFAYTDLTCWFASTNLLLMDGCKRIPFRKNTVLCSKRRPLAFGHFCSDAAVGRFAHFRQGSPGRLAVEAEGGANPTWSCAEARDECRERAGRFCGGEDRMQEMGKQTHRRAAFHLNVEGSTWRVRHQECL